MLCLSDRYIYVLMQFDRRLRLTLEVQRIARLKFSKGAVHASVTTGTLMSSATSLQAEQLCSCDWPAAVMLASRVCARTVDVLPAENGTTRTSVWI